MLILVAHGSRDVRWRTSVERMVEAVGHDVGAGRVRLAYMDLTPPTLGDVVADAVRSGTTRVQVLPLFLAAEGHVERDIVPLVEAVQAEYPELKVELLPPIGQHPEFCEALGRIERRVREGYGEPEPGTP